ncbi:hypothetical protein CDAR_314231 [Caerostris darwini]|uniref:Uncharacterized protein n=1 Tax=Caerostris darwini TaxID=1538125 RepID=A0AAV4U7D9_9ARAC|nr:hypothetical protein CDAR_314231 [Caerostris darwini]
MDILSSQIRVNLPRGPRVRADSQHPGHSAGRISSQLPDGWSHRNRRRGGRRAVHEWSEQPVQQKKISSLPTLEFFTQTSARERNLISLIGCSAVFLKLAKLGAIWVGTEFWLLFSDIKHMHASVATPAVSSHHKIPSTSQEKTLSAFNLPQKHRIYGLLYLHAAIWKCFASSVCRRFCASTSTGGLLDMRSDFRNHEERRQEQVPVLRQ